METPIIIVFYPTSDTTASKKQKPPRTYTNKRKLNREQVRAIYRSLRAGATTSELAQKYGVSSGSIWQIGQKQTYREWL